MIPLHPRGTLRARLSPAGNDIFRKLGIGARRCDLGDEGLYLAEEIVAADRWLGGSDDEVLGIAVLALMIAQRQGSSRLPLDGKPKGRLHTLVSEILRVADHNASASAIVKRIIALTARPGFTGVIGVGGDRKPLVVEDGCLYTERSRWLEQRVATRLRERLDAPRAFDREAIAGIASGLSAEQLHAVELAASGMLTVVTGGPGTGKTRVASAIVRAFLRLGLGPIALAAQTGKAANRLTEMIVQQLGADASLPAGQTLHRLLGYRGDGFAHHAQSPLPVGAVIVDEASMIDLELMDALLDALPASAPLVLIGDAHQLPAIDAGQILADLVDGAARVATLMHSYRMDASDPRGRAVLAAAEAIHAGEAHRLTDKHGLATLRTPGTLTWSGCEWIDQDSIATVHALASAMWHSFDGPRAQDVANRVVFRFTDGAVAPEHAADLEELWQLLGRARLLAVTRGLPTGSIALNAHVHDLALARMTVTQRPDFVPGEPVMITANDYQRGLFNGDQGIIVRADEGSGPHRYRAVFRVAGRLVPFAIEALRDRLELAWALTVHKSQGSELDAVALVLPDKDQPLLTRELLYTGLTRARTAAVVCGSKAAIAEGGKRRALRESGLRDRLRATLPA
jgi:exodeoxyribonuclease V alpha subunit